MSRPAVSVIVPFLGDAGEAARLIQTLRGLELEADDEVIVADNTAAGVVAAQPPLTVVAVPDVRSASHARNLAAARAHGEWLLFIDADCEPPADLISVYFAQPIDDRCGIVAGEIVGAPEQDAPLARWARARRGRWVSHHLDTGPYPGGITANLLIRRSAFAAVGGFRLGGGGDLDFCWRAQERGWGFAYRPDALVHHRDRERLGELVSQAVAYGGHQRRLRRIYGGAVPRVRLLRPLVRSLGGAGAWVARGRLEEARFKLVDGAWAAAEWWGWATRGWRARRAD